MNRNDAKKIAQTITNQQLQQMFNTAQAKITDWRKTSIVNKGMTKGVAWNILAKDFDVTANHSILYKTNMVREFGEFLPEDLKPKKKQGRIYRLVHQDPEFVNPKLKRENDPKQKKHGTVYGKKVPGDGVYYHSHPRAMKYPG